MITKYGRARADAERDKIAQEVASTPEGRRAFEVGGATLHAYATGLDVGERYVLLGKDAFDQPMRREAGSMIAVDAIYRAAWGYDRAYHIDSKGHHKVWTRGR